MNQSNEPHENEIRSPMPPNSPDVPPEATLPADPADHSAASSAPVAEEPAATKADPRRKAKKILLTLVISLVVLLLLNLIPFDRISEAATADRPKETAPVVTYNDSFFAIPDYGEDVTEDEIYQTKYNRLLTFERGNEAFTVTADTADQYGAVCVLFQNYMQTLMAGDRDAHDALFTDDYLEKNGAASFAPQKVFDMKVKVVRSKVLTDGDAKGEYKGYTVSYCEVTYKLRQNNGTLRRDFYREGDTIPLIFEVLEKDGTVEINEISTILVDDLTHSESKGVSIMMYGIWIAVVAVAIFFEAASATLTAIWFIPGAITSLILALCGFTWQTQVLVFFLLSLVLTVIGTLFLRKRILKKPHVPTNTDRIIGTTGIVTESIDNIAAKGEVKADGKRWSARSEDGSLIEEGALVTILRIEGVKLIVEKKN